MFTYSTDNPITKHITHMNLLEVWGLCVCVFVCVYVCVWVCLCVLWWHFRSHYSTEGNIPFPWRVLSGLKLWTHRLSPADCHNCWIQHSGSPNHAAAWWQGQWREGRPQPFPTAWQHHQHKTLWRFSDSLFNMVFFAQHGGDYDQHLSFLISIHSLRSIMFLLLQWNQQRHFEVGLLNYLAAHKNLNHSYLRSWLFNTFALTLEISCIYWICFFNSGFLWTLNKIQLKK